jgi:aspartate aminotransferase
MNHLLSDRINNLATSQTLAMAALARELKAQGKHYQLKFRRT